MMATESFQSDAVLEDISAMGALPTALLVGFAAPGTLELSWVDGLLAGLRQECAHVEAAIVGGDVTAAPTLS